MIVFFGEGTTFSIRRRLLLVFLSTHSMRSVFFVFYFLRDVNKCFLFVLLKSLFKKITLLRFFCKRGCADNHIQVEEKKIRLKVVFQSKICKKPDDDDYNYTDLCAIIELLSALRIWSIIYFNYNLIAFAYKITYENPSFIQKREIVVSSYELKLSVTLLFFAKTCCRCSIKYTIFLY